MTLHPRQPVIAQLASGPLSTIYGIFQMHVFHDGTEEAIVLTLGEVQGTENILCRIQSECVSSHVFFGTICDCREQMSASLELMQIEGTGFVIFLRQEGRGNGAAAHVATLDLRRKGHDQSEAYRLRGYPEDARSYNIAAKVLEYFGITSVRLISGNKNKEKALLDHNIHVTELVYYNGNIIQLGDVLESMLLAFQNKAAVLPIPTAGTRVLILGDLNIDYSPEDPVKGGQISNKPDPKVGGTGFNLAVACKEEYLIPILFGKIGDDQNGRLVKEALREKRLFSLLDVHKTKATGESTIRYFEDSQRWLEQDKVNANDYDPENLTQALTLSQLTADDFIFIATHPFFRSTLEHCNKLFTLLHQSQARIIVDIVPHNLYKTITLEQLKSTLGDRIFAVIGEYPTLMRFTRAGHLYDEPPNEDYKRILNRFSANIILCRYGIGNISKQSILRKDGDTYEWIERGLDTGYTETPDEYKRGFGDRTDCVFYKESGARNN